MTSTERVWMTRQAHTRLKTELAALRSRRGIEVPDDFMDYDDDNLTAHLALRARIHQIQGLLGNAIVGEDPPDDGIAEPGMELTVCYDDTGEIETFLLGVRGVEDTDIDVYSMQSPLGRAIAGARPDEPRTYSIPSGANLPVTLLKAVPYGMHTPKSRRPQALPPRRNSGPRRPAATRTNSGPTKRTPTTSRRAVAATKGAGRDEQRRAAPASRSAHAPSAMNAARLQNPHGRASECSGTARPRNDHLARPMKGN